MNFTKYFKKNKFVILDGALGTELQRRGIKTSLPLWSAQALLENPRLVQEIHEDYIKAGAEIITTNTFRTNIRTVKKSGIRKSAKELTFLAVRLAKMAVRKSGKRIFVAGSIAPVEDCYSPDLVPSPQELKREHHLLAKYLKNSGVDLILIETMNTLREAVIATQEALKTRLPVLVSFAISDNGHLLSGESLKEMVKILEKLKITALLINCFSPTISLKPLEALVRITKLPVGIYANGIGQPDNAQGWKFTGGKDKEKYLSYVKKWERMGVKIIGGCCGTTPEYIKRISQFKNTGT